MNAIIWFDVAAIGLLFILWYVMLLRRGIAGRQIRDFYVLVFFVSGSTVSDYLSTLLDLHARELITVRFPLGIFMMLSCTLYYAFHMSSMVAFFNYLNTVMNVEWTTDRNMIILRDIPVLTGNILIFTNPLTHWIFYYDENLVYHRGPYVALVYGVALFYMFLFVGFLIRYRTMISRQKRMTMFIMAGAILAATVIQLFLPMFRVENFFNSLTCVLVYLYVESPINYIDVMTGLLNDESFRVHSSVAIKKKRQMHFLLLTMDNLEEWESRVGRMKTNSMIIDVAGFLGTLDPQIRVYRIFPHEFLLWFLKGTEDRVDEVEDLLHDQFSDSMELDEYSMALAICTMRLNFPENVQDGESLWRVLIMMAELFRHRNRSRLSFKDLNLAQEDRRRIIDKALLEDIRSERFRFGWQPTYSMKDARYRFLDTDVLMEIAKLGEVRASQFMDIAEQNGAIERIFPFAFESICREFSKRRYQDSGIEAFLVKLPKTQIINSEARERIIAIVDRFGIEHSRVRFKLDEDTIQVYEGQIREGIEALFDEGFTFSLNNYGYGYTNAEMVIKMPIQDVTLDNRLTWRGENSKMADSILMSAVNLFKKLHIDVKAEHIENEKQFSYARKLGCSLVQGYYFAQLLFEGEVESFFEGHPTKLPPVEMEVTDDAS